MRHVRWIPSIAAALVVLVTCISIEFAAWAVAVFTGLSLCAGLAATRFSAVVAVMAGLLAPTALLVVLFVAGGGH
jgi:hypothetical protein